MRVLGLLLLLVSAGCAQEEVVSRGAPPLAVVEVAPVREGLSEPTVLVGDAVEIGRGLERAEQRLEEAEEEVAEMASVVVFVHCYAESAGIPFGPDGKAADRMGRALERGGDRHTRKCVKVVRAMSDEEKIARSNEFVEGGTR